MDRKIIPLIILVCLLAGCAGFAASSVRQGTELTSYTAITNRMGTMGGEKYEAFDPNNVESALPELGDLPMPASLKRPKTARQYTGIIKNKTNYEVSVPSDTSGSTLVIPAKGFIEYISWARQFDLTAYYDGKPFYCMKIFANPKTHPFMCKKYDFMIEIVKAEPKRKPVGKKKKAIKRRKAPADRGVEALG